MRTCVEPHTLVRARSDLEAVTSALEREEAETGGSQNFLVSQLNQNTVSSGSARDSVSRS